MHPWHDIPVDEAAKLIMSAGLIQPGDNRPKIEAAEPD